MPIQNINVTSNDINVSANLITTPTGIPVNGGSTAVTLLGSIDYITYSRSCSGSWQGYDYFTYSVCSSSYVPKTSTATVYIVANPGPANTPATITLGSSRSITFDAATYFTQTVFPINWSTLTGDSSTSTGTIAYNTATHKVTFTLSPGMASYPSTTFNYLVCDNPQAPPASLPSNVPYLCTTGTVTINVPKDSDGDGVPDAFDIDLDNDGILNINESPGLPDPIGDANNDGVLNIADPTLPQCGGLNSLGYCKAYDLDGDLVPNCLDLDADGDSIPDIIEGFSSTFLSYGGGGYVLSTLDVDQNGVLDGTNGWGTNGYDVRVETAVDSGVPKSAIFGTPPFPDTDGDGHIDSLDLDTDADGVPDLLENKGFTLPYPTALDSDHNSVVDNSGGDMDHDGIPNMYDSVAMALIALQEIEFQSSFLEEEADDDDDSLWLLWLGGSSMDSQPSTFGSPTITVRPPNANPSATGSAIDREYDGIADFRDLDSDGDGVLDLLESGLILQSGSRVTTVDTTPNDGVIDKPWTDADKDGITSNYDSSDATYGTINGNAGAIRDTDNDGIPDMYDLDSDNDGISDVVRNRSLSLSRLLALITLGIRTCMNGATG